MTPMLSVINPIVLDIPGTKQHKNSINEKQLSIKFSQTYFAKKTALLCGMKLCPMLSKDWKSQ